MNKPSWDEAPEWANWIAQDRDGEWWWFEYQPEESFEFNGWRITGGFADEATRCQVNDKWYDTLQERPQQTKEDDSMTTLDPDAIYFQVPVETESDMTVALLSKQLEAVESGMQDLLKESDDGEHRGQDMVDFTRVRDALVDVINFNSEYKHQISKEWQQK